MSGAEGMGGQGTTGAVGEAFYEHRRRCASAARVGRLDEGSCKCAINCEIARWPALINCKSRIRSSVEAAIKYGGRTLGGKGRV